MRNNPIYILEPFQNCYFEIAVPILPDYLSQLDNQTRSHDRTNHTENQNVSSEFSNRMVIVNQTTVGYIIDTDQLWNPMDINDENSSVGILLATKALVQLIATPIVKNLINSFGYSISLTLGTFVLSLASFGLYRNMPHNLSRNLKKKKTEQNSLNCCIC